MRIRINDTLILGTVLTLFIIFWFIISSNPQTLSILWFVIVLIIAVIFIMIYRNISRMDMIAALILSIAPMTVNLFKGIVSGFAYLGGMSVFKKNKNKIQLIKENNKYDIVMSILIGIIVGVILGLINISLGMTEMSINPSFQLDWLIAALSSGISEEIIFRFFFFAMCVHFTNTENFSRIQNFLCYLIMIVPHVLLHFERVNIDLGSILILSLLFGLPFALLQRKRDLSSAVTAHAVVNLMRFSILGA